MMTVEQFYQELETYFQTGDNDALEDYYRRVKKEAAQRREKLQKMGVCACSPMDERNRDEAACTDLLIAALNEEAGHYRGRSDFGTCMPLYAELLREMRAAGLEGTQAYAVALYNRGTAWRFMGDPEKALRDFDEAEHIFRNKETHDAYVIAGFYNNRASIYAQRGSWEQASEDYRQAIALLEQMPDADQERAVALASLSGVRLQAGDVEGASRAVDQAMEIYRTKGESAHTGATLSAKATIYFSCGEYAKAADLFDQAAEITKRYFGENHEYTLCIRNRDAMRARSHRSDPGSS